MKSSESNFDLRLPGSYLVRSYLITTVKDNLNLWKKSAISHDVSIRCSHIIEEIRQMLLKFKSSKRQQKFENEICHFA